MSEPIVIYCQQPINEVDSRTRVRGNTMGTADQGPNGFYGAYDWRVWDGTGYGQQIQRALNLGKEYSADVLDCGQYLSVTAHYQNPANGKKISQTFIIVLQSPKDARATVFMTSTKWRTVSSMNQAANYIGSTIKSLSGLC